MAGTGQPAATAAAGAVRGQRVNPIRPEGRGAYPRRPRPRADFETRRSPSVPWRDRLGGNPLGYGLGSVGVVFEAAPSAAQLANLSVSIWSSLESGGQNNNPDSQLYALSTPTNITAGSVALFTAPEGTRLAPNTSYVVAVLRSGTLAGVQLGTTSTNMKDSGAAPGWSILNTLHRRFTSGGQPSGSLTSITGSCAYRSDPPTVPAWSR